MLQTSYLQLSWDLKWLLYSFHDSSLRTTSEHSLSAIKIHCVLSWCWQLDSNRKRLSRWYLNHFSLLRNISIICLDSEFFPRDVILFEALRMNADSKFYVRSTNKMSEFTHHPIYHTNWMEQEKSVNRSNHFNSCLECLLMKLYPLRNLWEVI